MEIMIGIFSSLSTTFVLGIVGFLARNLILERLKIELQKEHSLFLDQLQWDRKAQEQASRVAEYLSLARRLSDDSPELDYRKANQLSWELAMWLPSEVYRNMTMAIAHPHAEANEMTVTIEVRKILLGSKAGDLTADDIAQHAAGIGRTGR